MSSSNLKTNLSTGASWKRLLFVLLFAVIYSLAELVLVATVVFQFGALLIAGRKNSRVLNFSGRVARYMYDILRYVTFNSDLQPYPFSSWPTGHADPDEDRSTDSGRSDDHALPGDR